VHTELWNVGEMLPSDEVSDFHIQNELPNEGHVHSFLLKMLKLANFDLLVLETSNSYISF
jgi:hypothetical protein